jgi:hypothetical protein
MRINRATRFQDKNESALKEQFLQRYFSATIDNRQSCV